MRRALAFLTPVGGAAVPDEQTMSWFPLAGALIGAAVGTVWWAAAQIWPPAVAAAIAVAADLCFTGMLHFDGLVDSADGLLPHMTRDRRLLVMREPTIGAFGVLVAIGALMLRWSALSSLQPDVLLVAALWAGSRTVMAVAARTLGYARPAGGLATAMIGGRSTLTAIYGVAGALTLGSLADGVLGICAVATVFVLGATVLLLGHRRIGGFTGDVLGAAGVVGETTALLVAAL